LKSYQLAQGYGGCDWRLIELSVPEVSVFLMLLLDQITAAINAIGI